MSAPSVEIKGVSRSFGSLKAVDNVSLSVQVGEVLALLGASGSGKSTLLRIVAGLEGVDQGEVHADGHLVSNATTSLSPEKRGLGMVFQDYALFPHLTAAQNIMFGLRSLGKEQAKAKAYDWMGKVGLSARADYFPHQLSGGEQQRVALARALAPMPKAVLMDEPFSGLDPYLRADLQSLTLETLRASGVGAIIVSHDTDEALAIADQVAIMDKGRILQAGPPREVYEAPVALRVARALGPIWTCECTSEKGQVVTPFGTFETLQNGPLVLVGRPEATLMSHDAASPFIVTDVRGVGRLVTVTLRHKEQRIQALIASHLAPSLGQPMALSLAPKDAFLFPLSSVGAP
jgi:iron(III) transport system ATP-binding protein